MKPTLASLFPNVSESTIAANPKFWAAVNRRVAENAVAGRTGAGKAKRGVMNKTPKEKLEHNARYYYRHRERRLAQVRDYNALNRVLINEKSRERSKRPEVKIQRQANNRHRYSKDIAFRMYTVIRTRLNRLAKSKCKQKSALRTISVLG